MDLRLKERFLGLWERYFDGAELPIVFYYIDGDGGAEGETTPSRHRCVLSSLVKVRRGKVLYLDRGSVGCHGGRRYLGFSQRIMPKFEYFLSCGIPGEMEGERYKKSPELVKELMSRMPRFRAPKRRIVFKRWDALREEDEPSVVIFFAKPDVLSGLFTLANYDEVDQHVVVAPFGAGCATIVQYPYLESLSPNPRCIIGMFDVSARPFVPPGTLTFAVSMGKFERMVQNMDESFLITPSWERIRKRLQGP